MLDHARFRWVPVPWCRPSCPLSWPERVVWGCLVAHPDDCRSVRSLEPLVPVSRPTIGAAIAGLERHGLVHKEQGGWTAVEPTGQVAEWFAPKDGPTWRKRVSYWACAVPSLTCPLPSTAVGLCWLAAALQRHGRPTTAAGLASFLGCDPKTVSASIGRLAERGVLSFTRGAGGRTRSRITFADPLPPAWDSWWERRRNKRAELSSVATAERVAPAPLAVDPKNELLLPHKVQPAQKVTPAEAPPKQDPAGLPGRVQPEAWEHNRGVWESWFDESFGPRHGLRRRVLAAAEEIAQCQGFWPQAGDTFRDAEAAHDFDQYGDDWAPLLWDRVRRRLDAAREHKAAEDRARALKDAAFAPLRALGLSPQVECPACGKRQSCDVGPVSEARWPAEVKNLADAVRQVPGVNHVAAGPRGQNCGGCRSAWPGLILSAQLHDGWERMSGGITFPRLEPLPEQRDFLDELGPPTS